MGFGTRFVPPPGVPPVERPGVETSGVSSPDPLATTRSSPGVSVAVSTGPLANATQVPTTVEVA